MLAFPVCGPGSRLLCVIDVLLTYFSESCHVALEHLSVFVSLIKKSLLLLLHTVLNNISTFTSGKKCSPLEVS